ncbi:hypothetical protein WJX72_010382 [[Myrmecia] bisecta]|uniref:CR-type domain-containing protein n=1 Tax=[Myrmecia] bisecta TaxID=41462 RepID=A0AAW1PTN2_9CHLO
MLEAGYPARPRSGGDADDVKEFKPSGMLHDAEMQKGYDAYGADANNDGMGSGDGGGGMADIFKRLGGGGGMRQTREWRGEDVVRKDNSLTQNIKCETCSGAGTKSGRKCQCDVCHGLGAQVMMRPITDGMMHRIEQPCSSCNQIGVHIPQDDVCTVCLGKGLVPDVKVFDVHVEQGHKDGDTALVLRGEAGCCEPNLQPGDVIFVLEQTPHKSFERVDNVLIYEKEISLTEALCGTHFHIPHLDGRSLSVTSGMVMKPDSLMMCIKGEGMPVLGSPHIKGDLFIIFSVVFPETISSEQLEMLKRALPGPSATLEKP